MSNLPPYPETPDIETSSEDYAKRFSGPVGEWFLSVQRDATLDMLRDFPNGRILDVGGGHGQLTPSLVQKGYNVMVLGSHESCRLRIRPLTDRGLCKFEVGNILALPYPDRSFDVVVSYRLLPHVYQWEKCVSELCRVADRAVLVDYPSLVSMNYLTPFLFGVKKKLEGNTRTYTLFREDRLKMIFRKHGFIPAGRFPEFFFPMVFHRILKLQKWSSIIEYIARRLGLTHLFGSPVILKLVREG